nr:FAD-dependent oxidoreductase [Desulfobacterales bacterium]
MTVKGPDLALEADLVLVAVGITPASELAAAAGLQTSVNGAIAVDAHQRTSDQNVYAAGDCADAFHAVTGKRTWIPLALRANRAGWAVADNVCGIDRRLAGLVGSAVFKVFDYQVARTGLNVEEARAAGFEAEAVTIKSRSRAHAHPGSSTIHVHMVGDRGSGRLLGVQMVGRDGVAHRLHAPAVALHAHMSVEQFSQSDLGYAPPFGPTWDPMLTAANQLLKKL